MTKGELRRWKWKIFEKIDDIYDFLDEIDESEQKKETLITLKNLQTSINGFEKADYKK